MRIGAATDAARAPRGDAADERRVMTTWLAGGFVLAFAVPFLLADVLDLNRDLFYGLYASSRSSPRSR
jgi:hypothetical protein